MDGIDILDIKCEGRTSMAVALIGGGHNSAMLARAIAGLLQSGTEVIVFSPEHVYKAEPFPTLPEAYIRAITAEAAKPCMATIPDRIEDKSIPHYLRKNTVPFYQRFLKRR